MASVSTILLAITYEQEWAAAKSVLTNEYGYRVLVANTEKKALKLAEDANIDLVICESSLEGESALHVLQQCRVICPNAMRILVKESNGGNKKNREAAERAAIYQFIRKPIDAEQVGMVVKRALEAAELSRRHRLISRELKLDDDSPVFANRPGGKVSADCSNFEKLVYVSESMAELCNIAKQAARTDLPILIQGETGTGKELMARAIHFNSNRTDSPLIVQNCGGISDEMLHSELFGHVRGAFPGAISDRLGLFRAADGGTVFLDEISEISPAFQVSLLRLVQEGEVKPLGSDRVYHCDVRIICASNRRLSEMVAKGDYRQDLYFRLKGFELVVPPLRERREDIAVLAEFFTQKYTELTNVNLLGISNDVLDRLQLHPFPGNVRELENEIQRMVALASDGEYLTSRHMSEEFSAIIPDTSFKASYANLPLDGATLKEKVESLEKHLVTEALRRLRWNQSKVAKELGLSRVGLANKIKRYQLANTG